MLMILYQCSLYAAFIPASPKNRTYGRSLKHQSGNKTQMFKLKLSFQNFSVPADVL